MGRKWRGWFKNTLDNLGVAGGVVGVGGIGLAAIGGVVAAPVVATIGGVLIVGVVGWSAYHGFPQNQPKPRDAVGKVFYNLEELAAFDPPLTKVGFVGASSAGKSTLLDHVRGKTPTQARTENIYACVVALQTSPQQFIAVVDAAGQEYSQQFLIVENSDILILLMDHNASHTDSTTAQNRLSEHEQFSAQLRGSMRTKNKNVNALRVLLNKRDLWETKVGAPELRRWFTEQISTWRHANVGKISHNEHSNLISNDVTALSEFLRQQTAR